MIGKNAKKTVDSLSSAISVWCNDKSNGAIDKIESDVDNTAIYLRDFILTYFSNTTDSTDVESKKTVLDCEFGLTAGLFHAIKLVKQESIRDLLQYFISDSDESHLFCFLGGGSGYGRLYFDNNKNTVMFSGSSSEHPEMKKRFIDTYGSETVKLNIKKKVIQESVEKFNSQYMTI
jgi:hypothetical protein